LPTIPEVPAKSFGDGFHVLAIATFAADEPFREIIEAARELPSKYTIHFTGDPRKVQDRMEGVPSNVEFLGFLPENEYWSAVLGCDAVLDLTLMPDCLVCGAYEALAAEKPMVLSDNSASREIFGDVAVFTAPNSPSIRDALIAVEAELPVIRKRAPTVRQAYERSWGDAVARLRHVLE
jgi:glycosyltransferase involved in cell wall biosynthesis